MDERFQYFDKNEGIYWLERAKKSSFHANILLSEIYFSSDYNFDKYGESLLNAIDLHESGASTDYISESSLVNVYQDSANYFYQIGVPEKAEFLLRKSSLYFVESDQNRFDVWRKTLLAGVSSDYEASITYLEGLVEEHKTRESVKNYTLTLTPYGSEKIWSGMLIYQTIPVRHLELPMI